jgi:hypothetical protein
MLFVRGCDDRLALGDAADEGMRSANETIAVFLWSNASCGVVACCRRALLCCWCVIQPLPVVSLLAADVHYYVVGALYSRCLACNSTCVVRAQLPTSWCTFILQASNALV